LHAGRWGIRIDTRSLGVLRPEFSAAAKRPRETTCAVCYADVADDGSAMEGCGHVFCASCLQKWTGTCADRAHNVPTRSGVTVSCPTCRRPTRRPVDAAPSDDDDGGDDDASAPSSAPS